MSVVDIQQRSVTVWGWEKKDVSPCAISILEKDQLVWWAHFLAEILFCFWRAEHTSLVPVGTAASLECLWCLLPPSPWIVLFLMSSLSLHHTFPAEMISMNPWSRNKCWLISIAGRGRNNCVIERHNKFSSNVYFTCNGHYRWTCSCRTQYMFCSWDPGIFGLNLCVLG
jgi:hypothetical protein